MNKKKCARFKMTASVGNLVKRYEKKLHCEQTVCRIRNILLRKNTLLPSYAIWDIGDIEKESISERKHWLNLYLCQKN